MSWVTSLFGINRVVERAITTPAADRPSCCEATATYILSGIALSEEQWVAVEKVKLLYTEGRIVKQLTPRK